MIVQILDSFDEKVVYETEFNNISCDTDKISDLFEILRKNIENNLNENLFLKNLKYKMQENDKENILTNLKNFKNNYLIKVLYFYKDMEKYMKNGELKYPYKLILK